MVFKPKPAVGDLGIGRLGNDSFGRATANVADAMRYAVAILRQEVGAEFASYDAVAVCQMIMDENYRLETTGEELN
jgi:hypothetical protein